MPGNRKERKVFRKAYAKDFKHHVHGLYAYLLLFNEETWLNNIDSKFNKQLFYQMLNPIAMEITYLNNTQPRIVAHSQHNSGSTLPEMLTALGIRRIMHFSSGTNFSSTPCISGNDTKTNKIQMLWSELKKHHPVEDLKALFNNARLVLFNDWASMVNASELWDGFLNEVIKPLERKKRKFVFRLGDAVNKKVFEVDEILDIISDFSLYGFVSLVLEQNEAAGLYRLLNGMPWPASHSVIRCKLSDKEYHSIFQTMRIHQLIICFADKILTYRRNEQFELSGITVLNKETALLATINV